MTKLELQQEIEALQDNIAQSYRSYTRANQYKIATLHFEELRAYVEKMEDLIQKYGNQKLYINYKVALSAVLSQLDYLRRNPSESWKYPHQPHYYFCFNRVSFVLSEGAVRNISPKIYVTPITVNELAFELHLLYQDALDNIYKDRDAYPRAVKDFIELCQKDIQLVVDNVVLHGRWEISSFFKLTNFYEKQKKYNDAIEICEIAIECNIPHNHNFDYYKNKKNKLQEKISKAE